ncbi:MAG: hypothetical protein ACE5FC_10515, partial [Myxococcota bacterium]
MKSCTPGKAVPGDLMDPNDRIVADFEKVFGGIEVAGFDLAAASRLSLYVALQTKEAFASPTLRERAPYTLLSNLVFLRARMPGASPPPSLPAVMPPKVLFFFVSENPSCHESLLPVMARFGADAARAVATYPKTALGAIEHEWIDIRSLLSARTGPALKGVEASLRAAQQRTASPIFRRASLRAWLMRAAIRMAAAAP